MSECLITRSCHVCILVHSDSGPLSSSSRPSLQRPQRSLATVTGTAPTVLQPIIHTMASTQRPTHGAFDTPRSGFSLRQQRVRARCPDNYSFSKYDGDTVRRDAKRRLQSQNSNIRTLVLPLTRCAFLALTLTSLCLGFLMRKRGIKTMLTGLLQTSGTLVYVKG